MLSEGKRDRYLDMIDRGELPDDLECFVESVETRRGGYKITLDRGVAVSLPMEASATVEQIAKGDHFLISHNAHPDGAVEQLPIGLRGIRVLRDESFIFSFLVSEDLIGFR